MALSNVKRTVLGGGLVAIHGTYAHTEGAAPLTIEVGSGEIYAVHINPQTSAASAIDVRGDLYSTSISGAINTVTLNNVGGITGGTFFIIAGN